MEFIYSLLGCLVANIITFSSIVAILIAKKNHEMKVMKNAVGSYSKKIQKR